jgi:hypothetical protein
MNCRHVQAGAAGTPDTPDTPDTDPLTFTGRRGSSDKGLCVSRTNPGHTPDTSPAALRPGSALLTAAAPHDRHLSDGRDRGPRGGGDRGGAGSGPPGPAALEPGRPPAGPAARRDTPPPGPAPGGACLRATAAPSVTARKPPQAAAAALGTTAARVAALGTMTTATTTGTKTPAAPPTRDAHRAALRRYLGPGGRFRIDGDGTIHALIGAWIVFGRVGEPRTRATLLDTGPRPGGGGAGRPDRGRREPTVCRPAVRDARVA